MKKRIKSAFMGLNNNKYYGIEDKNSMSNKGFITRTDYYGGHYIPICRSGITHGNTWSQYREKELTALIDKLIKERWQVYEFNTYESLFNWLRKN